jgi:phosphoribosylanthranilate isomerase
MHKVRVKICGITEYEAASMAARLGVDALGFIFAESPRQVAPDRARAIIRKIPPFIKTVGVFVNETPEAIREVMHYCGLDLVQLHGDASPALCQSLMPCTIKVLRIKNESSARAGMAYRGKVRALLLDTFSEEKAGGTGMAFDWELALKIKKLQIPIILSGGLGPSNVREAIRTVEPYAVDVNSGVEECPGRKNPLLMKALMEKLRGSARQKYTDSPPFFIT